MSHYNSNFNFPRLQLLLFPILLLHFISHALHNLQWIWTTTFAITKGNRKAPLSAEATISAWIAIDPVIFFRIHPLRFILEKAITTQKSYHLVSLWKCIATRATTHTANIKASSGISLKLKGRNISPNDKTKPTTKSHYMFLAEIGFFLIIFAPKAIWVHVAHTCIMKQMRQKLLFPVAVIHPQLTLWITMFQQSAMCSVLNICFKWK